ncbi:MAG: hypothetical protein FJW38_31680 [Acidobacteria bacterium]|nr:hypothetical protein [Acidobacteriota bacterium]
MFYTPDAIALADIPIARNHSVGGEKRLFVSKEPARQIGSVFLKGDADAEWIPDEINTLPVTGADLQAKVDDELDADAAPLFTFTGTDQADVALQGTSTFSPPSYVANKGFDFSEGVALDIVPGTAGKLFKTLSGVTATNAKKWSRLKVFQLPSAASWKSIAMVESVDVKIGTKVGHPIPDELDGAKEVVAGRSEPSSITINAKHRSVVDGLQRYAGRLCCLRLEVWKQGKILVERHVYANCILQVNPNFPDGSDEVRQAAEGLLQEYFGFYAK